MSISKQLAGARALLESSTCPFFLYDNDADGLCSYSILRRWLGRGEGTAVRTHPDIDAGYARTAISYNADLVVVLDCPFLGEKFVKELADANIPILWIDHHEVDSPDYDLNQVHIFNLSRSKLTKKHTEPVTYWSYKIANVKSDAWIALMGCVADHYLPSFAKDVLKNYPDLFNLKKKDPFAIYYGSELGTFARALGFGLKDSNNHIHYLQRFIISCIGPHDFRIELSSGSSFANKVLELNKLYSEIMSSAHTDSKSKLLFFQYGGATSMSADIANALSFHYPKKYIAVAYVHSGLCNLSMRGKNVKALLESVLPLFEGANGGGHKDAVGARVRVGDIEKFKEALTNSLSKRL